MSLCMPSGIWPMHRDQSGRELLCVCTEEPQHTVVHYYPGRYHQGRSAMGSEHYGRSAIGKRSREPCGSIRQLFTLWKRFGMKRGCCYTIQGGNNKRPLCFRGSKNSVLWDAKQEKDL